MRDGGEGESAKVIDGVDKTRLDIRRLEGVVLVRLAVVAGGATASEVERDVRSLVAGLPDGALRSFVDLAIERHRMDGSIVKQGRRWSATPAGNEAVRRLLGCKGRLPQGWIEARDVCLVARALGLEKTALATKRGLRRVEGLRAALLLQRHALSLKGTPSVARLRAALAEKAWAEKAKAEKPVTAKSATHGGRKSARVTRTPSPTLSPHEQRLLAAGLATRVCSVVSDARLIGELAADAAGAVSGSLEALRTALLADFIRPRGGGAPFCAIAGTGREPPVPAPVAAERRREAAVGEAKLRGAALDTVARLVDLHARAVATGWHGDRKAFISRVWQSIRAADTKAALAEEDFKRLLVAAHAAGKVALAFADLKDSVTDAEIRASTVVSRNTVWHYVRVVDRPDPSG